VGPEDDGKSLIDLSAASQSQDNNDLIYGLVVLGVLGILVVLGAVIWTRRNKNKAL
jgi:hypothetical protein